MCKRVRVVFSPMEKFIEVEQGTILLDAIREVGLVIIIFEPDTNRIKIKDIVIYIFFFGPIIKRLGIRFNFNNLLNTSEIYKIFVKLYLVYLNFLKLTFKRPC